MKIRLRAEAMSNVTYSLDQVIEVDGDMWEEWSAEERRKFCDEATEEMIANDVSGWWEIVGE